MSVQLVSQAQIMGQKWAKNIIKKNQKILSLELVNQQHVLEISIIKEFFQIHSILRKFLHLCKKDVKMFFWGLGQSSFLISNE